MKTLFSKRHLKAIREKTIPLTFPYSIRVSILRTLQNHSVYGGYSYLENLTFEAMEELLKTFYGKNDLEAFNDAGERIS